MDRMRIDSKIYFQAYRVSADKFENPDWQNQIMGFFKIGIEFSEAADNAQASKEYFSNFAGNILEIIKIRIWNA